MVEEGEVMADKDMNISKLLQNSDKAELLEYLTEHLGEIEKCILYVGLPDGEGGLRLRVRQVGFKYGYEIQGFVDMVAAGLIEGDDDVDTD